MNYIYYYLYHQMITPQFHTPVTSTQVRHVWNPRRVEVTYRSDGFVFKWRILRGWTGVTLVWKGRVEVTDVWNWGLFSSNLRNADKAGLKKLTFSDFLGIHLPHFFIYSLFGFSGSDGFLDSNGRNKIYQGIH